MSNFDHYLAARELACRLEAQGYAADAAALRNAMGAGSTGTEIFMALRFYISGILQKAMLDDSTRLLASQLFAALDEALEQ